MMFRNLQIVTLDFETYFSAEYSLTLKKYNTLTYIRDPQFKVQCVGIKVGDSPVVWVPHERVAAALGCIDWANSALLCHNTAFDGYILSHRYGIVPAYYLDTLSMARAIHSNSISASLDSVSRYYGIGNKMPDVLPRTKGIRDLPDDLMKDLGQYCAIDTELCRRIFDKMQEKYPEAEFDLIDLTLRMYTQPAVHIDSELVQEALNDELNERQRLIDATGLTLKALRSDQQLADAFVKAGLPAEQVPRKWSKKQKKEVWAFAKGDLAFTALAKHENPAVRALVAGRLASKTSYGEGRALRFLEAGKDGQPWPILLNYCGAHTTRWTGGDKMNPQNLKRGGKLRASVIAPPGHVIVACDSSQIEARVVAWLAKHEEMLQAFRDWDHGTGPDVYKLMATTIYGKPIEEITKEERFVGKVVVLGAGYGMGGEKYQYTLEAGLMGPPMKLPLEECEKIIRAYRMNNMPIKTLWKKMEIEVLYWLANNFATDWGVLKLEKGQKILLPNGLRLHYPGLTGKVDKATERWSDFRYFDLDELEKRVQIENEEEKDELYPGTNIYGGLMTENITQALARVIVADQMLAISRELKVVTMTHDEVVCVAKESEADQAAAFMLQEMRKTPSWCTDLPLNAEAEYGHRYG